MVDEPTQNKDKVDRSRRHRFIAIVTAFCLLSSFVFTALTFFSAPVVAGGVAAAAPVSPLVDLYVRGMLSLATATVLTYIGGSVIDYNGGIVNMFGRKGNE